MKLNEIQVLVSMNELLLEDNSAPLFSGISRLPSPPCGGRVCRDSRSCKDENISTTLLQAKFYDPCSKQLNDLLNYIACGVMCYNLNLDPLAISENRLTD